MFDFSATTALSRQTGDRAAAYPLTPLQSGMLYHQIREDGGCGVDLEQLVCRTRERIDMTAFGAALESLVQLHPVLRTRFIWGDGDEPVQEIVEGVWPELLSVDRGDVAAGDVEEDFLRQLLADRETGLDLAQAPLIRCKIFAYLGGDTRILLTLHHAIIDGRCFSMLLEDLFGFYAAHVEGRAAPMPMPRLDYREFAEWTGDQDFESRSRCFWQDRLAGFTAPTPLTVADLSDCPSTEVSWQEEISLTADQTRALETLATDADVTLNTVVQAAWAALLGKYCGEEDVVFGGTRACRKSSLPGVEEAMGLFINTLPVRASTGQDKPLPELLRELRGQWVAMREHEHTPLGQIQSWSEVTRGQPLFESIVVFESFDLGTHMAAKGGAWAGRQIDLYEQTNFPLTVAAYHGEKLRIKIEFDTARFTPATVRRMLGHLAELLHQFARRPDATLGEFHLTTDAEVRAIREEWAKPQPFPVPGTLCGWFETQVAATPERTALVFEGEEWSYDALNRAANRVAHRLMAESGVQRGAIVGLCVDRSPEIVIGILGILKAGAAYLPIDLAYPAERLRWMLEDSAAPVLLTAEALLPRLPETTARALTFESIAAADEDADNPLAGGTPDDLAYVIFTSGSTGKPKGCRVTHRNVARLMTSTEGLYHFDQNDVWTLFHSFAFDFSVWEIWGALLYGGKLVVVPYDTTRSPDDFYALLETEAVTVLNQTPSAFRQLAEAEQRLGGGPEKLALRYVIFGGEALETESLRQWFDLHGDVKPQMVNMYGITETTVHVTHRALSKADLNGGSVIGRPLPDLEIHLLDPAGQPVPIGVPGEIYVGGEGVADGYLNRPELSAERFVPHPFGGVGKLYRSGDVGRFLPGGELEYLGRCDQQVKIRGFRIELGEIQNVMSRYPAVREAFVTTRGRGADEKIVAYLVADRDAAPLADLRRHAGDSLPPYMIPGDGLSR